MRYTRPCRTLLTLAVLASPLSAQQAAPSWGPIETILGRPGSVQPGGVVRFSFPRSDLTVVVGDTRVLPTFALGSWVAFAAAGHGETMAMGDLVLTEEEVAPVMRALQQGGVEQTALHNHLLMESPRVMYMHIAAHGDAAKMATAIRSALAATGTPLGPPAAAATPSAAGLDTAGIVRALGYSGKLNGVVYQVSVPRHDRITARGHPVPPSMGVATAINFQPTADGKVAITGDFVLRGREVNPVIRALQTHGIQPTAIHSHMLDEEPRLFFMHFWATGDAVRLAEGLRAALDETATKKSK